jgi:hypothetical protein
MILKIVIIVPTLPLMIAQIFRRITHTIIL